MKEKTQWHSNVCVLAAAFLLAYLPLMPVGAQENQRGKHDHRKVMKTPK